MSINIELEKEEHGIIVGQTRTGKSYLAKMALLPLNGRLAIIDPKREFQFQSLPVYDDPAKIWRARPKRFIYRPKPEFFSDENAYNSVYKYVYDMGAFFCFTDEIVATLQGMRPCRYMVICYQMGASRGIHMLTATQRPSRIPVMVMSESAKWYVFTLSYPADIKKMAEILPGYLAKMPSRRHFAFYDIFRSSESRILKLHVEEE